MPVHQRQCYMICLSLSSALSLTPFPRSSTRGGNFLTNVSLNPPTQPPTARWDWQKRKKIWILYKSEKMLQAFLPYMWFMECDTTLYYCDQKARGFRWVRAEMNSLLFSQVKLSWLGWHHWNSDCTIRNSIWELLLSVLEMELFVTEQFSLQAMHLFYALPTAPSAGWCCNQ